MRKELGLISQHLGCHATDDCLLGVRVEIPLVAMIALTGTLIASTVSLIVLM